MVSPSRRCWLVEYEDELLGGIGLRRRPIRLATRTGAVVYQVLHGMSRVFGRVVDRGHSGEVQRSRLFVVLSRLVQLSLPRRGHAGLQLAGRSNLLNREQQIS